MKQQHKRIYLHTTSIARKMSWAASRNTARIEDRAYSLLGIFDVNIPMLYGEGAKAFIRLQEEIIKQSDDQSILAWESPYVTSYDVPAPLPRCFINGRNIITTFGPRCPYTLTNAGLNIRLPIVQDNHVDRVLAILNCRYEDNFVGPIAILLRRLHPGDDSEVLRDNNRGLVVPDLPITAKAKNTSLFIRRGLIKYGLGLGLRDSLIFWMRDFG